MSNMPNMLAYAVKGGLSSNYQPTIVVGQGKSGVSFYPQNAQDDTYWIAIIDAMKPTTLVKDFLVPGSNNSSVPAGLDTYMTNPQYLFAVVTQCLSTLHVPQGAWYNYLVSHGAGRELQKLEELNASLSCGTYSSVSYLLTGSCGPTGGVNPPPPSYELGSYNNGVVLLMSLMPLPNGQGPYTLCDSYTFPTS